MTMKDHLEDKFKEVINQYEVPYDPAAWNQLAGTLDKRFPASGGSSSWKWFFGGGLVIVVALGSLYFSNNSKSKADQVASRNTTSNSEIAEHQTADNSDENTATTKSDGQSAVGAQGSNMESDASQVSIVSDKNGTTNYSDGVKSSDTWLKDSYPVSQENTTPESPKTVVYPTVSDLCPGENVSIENSNESDIFLSDLQKVYPIPAGKKFNFTAENPGNYYFGKSIDGKIEYSKIADFKVKSAVQVSIEVESDSKYENGVPTTALSAKASESCTFSWKIESLKGELTGREVTPHFYNKGTYDVELTATPKDGGCATTVNHQISIEETYNLLAVNSFWPNSPNPKNATFMPYALTERNTDFSMMVIDPANGVTLFETSDATNGWNGTNRTTGQLVDANKAYIWIVKLKNPLPGEKSEYKGTIVRMP
ncbi:MAG: hypothetical protein RIT43_2049 [Bacteroidota bacterium]